MEISKRMVDGTVEVAVSGRLDAYWADHLSAALDEALREGADVLRLDMSAVSYMSSVGIRVLLHFHKELARLGGSFSVSHPSPAVKAVLELAGLEALLAAGAASRAPAGPPTPRRFEHGAHAFDVFDLEPDASLRCRAVGEPERLSRGTFGAEQCRPIAVTGSILAVGLGAFGSSFEDCRDRFGELLAVAGGAAHQPTDGTNVADFLLATGAFVPELQMLYGLVCEGSFARLARFDASPQAAMPLRALAEASLEIAGADTVAMAVVAESAGLLGAALRRSPAAAAPIEPFAYDVTRLRQWLSFSPERVHARGLALIAGVVTRIETPETQRFLRPLGGGGRRAAHFHAASFSYSPLRKGRIDLGSTVTALHERERLQAVLHLLNDDREIVGGGESQLVRGACWIGPISAWERA